MNESSPEQRLKNMGIRLPEAPVPAGSYVPCARGDNLVFVSGQLPMKDGKLLFRGKAGDELTVEEAGDCARLAAVNSLAVLRAELKEGLSGVAAIVKVTGYVASADGFTRQADVVNGASDLYAAVFGEKGRHARAAVGVAQLPLGAPVEIEVIAEVKAG